MSKKIKILKLSILFGIIILITYMPIYAYIWANHTECGYEGELCDTGGTGSGGELYIPETEGTYYVSIGDIIIDSAGHLLNAYSSMTKLLGNVETAELKGTDFNAMREILYSTIEDMERANTSLTILNAAAATRPYNWPVIYRLWFFDYYRFQNENHLLPGIFDKVKSYLYNGDIRGVYAQCLKDNEAILDQLYTLKEHIDADKFPEINSLWRLNQAYVSTLLFGQYTSQVFKSILN